VHFKTICCSESSRPWLLPTLTGSFGHVMISTMKDKIKLVFFSYYVYHCPSPARDDVPMRSYHDIHLLTRSFLTSSQRVAPKRKYICPGRLYERGTLDWAVRPKPLNEAIPERRFEDSKFIPNLPNRLVLEFIWPKNFKEEKRNSQSRFQQVLTMRCLSKFWCTFVDQTNVIVDMHYSFILKKTIAEKAAAPGHFRN
jgi:hypothetical protein